MIFPVLKLGTLAVRTIAKPFTGRLIAGAGLHPKFRQIIINIAQVAGAAVIYEVQRNSRAEARKEEKRKRELEATRQSNNNLAKEVDHLKHKIEELSNRSIFSMFRFRHARAHEAQNSGRFK